MKMEEIGAMLEQYHADLAKYAEGEWAEDDYEDGEAQPLPHTDSALVRADQRHSTRPQVEDSYTTSSPSDSSNRQTSASTYSRPDYKRHPSKRSQAARGTISSGTGTSTSLQGVLLIAGC
jgi:hypothetical protein